MSLFTVVNWVWIERFFILCMIKDLLILFFYAEQFPAVYMTCIVQALDSNETIPHMYMIVDIAYTCMYL